jgi:cell wall-associated NlpC family hydrolase
MAKIPGLPVAFIGVGGVLVWSGIENQPVSAVLRSLARGQAPQKGPPETFATPGQSTGSLVPSSSGNLGSGSGAAIASDALRYAGHAYSYGGAPGPSGADPWDCSSFANWVIGHDSGLAIPFFKAGGYNGSQHGPATGSWLIWTGCTTVGHDASVAVPGDLAVWQTHMGICTGPNEMISALNPGAGTRVSPISGEIPEILFVRRLKAVQATSTIASAGPH